MHRNSKHSVFTKFKFNLYSYKGSYRYLYIILYIALKYFVDVVFHILTISSHKFEAIKVSDNHLVMIYFIIFCCVLFNKNKIRVIVVEIINSLTSNCRCQMGPFSLEVHKRFFFFIIINLHFIIRVKTIKRWCTTEHEFSFYFVKVLFYFLHRNVTPCVCFVLFMQLCRQ